MASIMVAGDAIVVTSSVALSDWKRVQKYRPDAMILYGGEDGKEPIFAVSVTEGKSGSINKMGVEFGKATRDDAALATLTVVYEMEEGDIKEKIADSIGVYVANLNKIEAKIPEVLAEIKTERDAIMANITVAQ